MMVRRGLWRRLLLLVNLLSLMELIGSCGSPEVCNTVLLPGPKGDKGEAGDVGEQGTQGKLGPPGAQGATGETGLLGEPGHMGKMGPIGDRGEKGVTGWTGPSGIQGKPVLLGLRETEERYYLLVTESRAFEEALVSCRLRGGALAMPKTRDANRLLADYVSGSGLTAVFIGLQARSVNGTRTQEEYVFADSSPLGGFAAWGPGQGSPSGTNNSSCVELLDTGSWAPAACHLAMFYICEFPKTRRRVGAAG
ncbi:collectin-10-like isoform X2 [Gadus macrocephalus]|uniref:collectin-10-like isoform X2 n=1 Tax=Gadus macrocephalus TaxID=80720 RepID=UPI0028CBB59D|nr:collectin-10-like isoform X2 [Gadus macrocephalus]